MKATSKGCGARLEAQEFRHGHGDIKRGGIREPAERLNPSGRMAAQHAFSMDLLEIHRRPLRIDQGKSVANRITPLPRHNSRFLGLKTQQRAATWEREERFTRSSHCARQDSIDRTNRASTRDICRGTIGCHAHVSSLLRRGDDGQERRACMLIVGNHRCGARPCWLKGMALAKDIPSAFTEILPLETEGAKCVQGNNHQRQNREQHQEFNDGLPSQEINRLRWHRVSNHLPLRSTRSTAAAWSSADELTRLARQ